MPDFIWPAMPLWLLWALSILTVTGFGFGLRGYLMNRYGHPRPEVVFILAPVPPFQYLMCKIFNRPIAAGMWSWLGVKTGSIEELWVSAGIRQGDTPVVGQKSVIIRRRGTTDGFVTPLPASRHAAEIYLIQINPENGTAIELISHVTAIKPGDYILDINIEVDGHPFGPREKRFKIQNISPFGEWLN